MTILKFRGNNNVDKNSTNIIDRLNYYKNNQLDLDCKYDSDALIRGFYYDNNLDDKSGKTDYSYLVRASYYQNNPSDKSGKYDNSFFVRLRYYQVTKNPSSKTDRNYRIRKMYYSQYPDDHDHKYDNSPYINSWDEDKKGKTPPYDVDGFERENLDDLSDLQICRTDRPDHSSISKTVSFKRKK